MKLKVCLFLMMSFLINSVCDASPNAIHLNYDGTLPYGTYHDEGGTNFSDWFDTKDFVSKNINGKKYKFVLLKGFKSNRVSGTITINVFLATCSTPVKVFGVKRIGDDFYEKDCVLSTMATVVDVSDNNNKYSIQECLYYFDPLSVDSILVRIPYQDSNLKMIVDFWPDTITQDPNGYGEIVELVSGKGIESWYTAYFRQHVERSINTTVLSVLGGLDKAENDFLSRERKIEIAATSFSILQNLYYFNYADSSDITKTQDALEWADETMASYSLKDYFKEHDDTPEYIKRPIEELVSVLPTALKAAGGNPDAWVSLKVQLAKNITSVVNSSAYLSEVNSVAKNMNNHIIAKNILYHTLYLGQDLYDLLGLSTSESFIEVIEEFVKQNESSLNLVDVIGHNFDASAVNSIYNTYNEELKWDWIANRAKSFNVYSDVDNDGIPNKNDNKPNTTYKDFSLDIGIGGSGKGRVISIEPSGNSINCDSSCSVDIESGETVSLRAIPGDGSIFTGWSGEDVSGEGDCSFLMDKDKNVSAYFQDTTSNNPELDLKILYPTHELNGGQDYNILAYLSYNDQVIKNALVTFKLTCGNTLLGSGELTYIDAVGGYRREFIAPKQHVAAILQINASVVGVGTATTSKTVSIQYTPPSNSGPYAIRMDPNDKYLDVLAGDQKRFKARGWTSEEGPRLETLKWYLNDVLLKVDNFESDENFEGYETHTVTFATSGKDQEVKAVVCRDDGAIDDVIWMVDVAPNASPVVTCVSPNLPEEGESLVLPLGEQEFSVSVFDDDDNMDTVKWYLNDTLIEEDSMSGGNPARVEKCKVVLSQKGNAFLKAVSEDDNGNRSTVTWPLYIGVSTPNNIPPVCEIDTISNTGLGENAVFRVGYVYDFRFKANDSNGNLAYGEVWIDGKQDWHWDPDHVYNYSDELEGFEDKATINDIVFKTTGQHTIRFVVRDTDGAESICEKTFDVFPADEGSSKPPIFGRIYPSPGQIFYLSGNDSSLDVFITAVDNDGDLENLSVYQNGALLKKIRLSNDTADHESVSVDFDTDGIYTIDFELVDTVGNKTRSGLYNVKFGDSAGTRNHAPEIIECRPLVNSAEHKYVVPLNPQGVCEFHVSTNQLDLDGDLDDSYWFSTAGPLPSDGGVWSDGRHYSRMGSNGTLEMNEDKRFEVSQAGTISCIVVDDKGNQSSEYVWHVVPTPSTAVLFSNGLGSGNAPEVQWCNFTDNINYNLALDNADVSVAFHVVDKDGDLERAELWLNDELRASKPISGGFSSIEEDTFDAGELHSSEPSNYDSDRGPYIPFEVKFIDRNGNISAISSYVSWGPYNHASSYPVQPVQLETKEDIFVSVPLLFSDEDDDVHIGFVESSPDNGAVIKNDAGGFVYKPDENYTGTDSFSMRCNDGFGSEAIVLYEVNIEPVSDPPVFMDENGVAVIERQVPDLHTGDIVPLRDVVSGLTYFDPEEPQKNIDDVIFSVEQCSDNVYLIGSDIGMLIRVEAKFLDAADVVLYAVDMDGNRSNNIGIQLFCDVMPPIIHVPDMVVVNAENSNGTSINHSKITRFLQAVTAVDEVDGPIKVVTNDAPSIFHIGETTVTFRASDVNGNTSTETGKVTVLPENDTDGDGIPNRIDDDDDNDGLPDTFEVQYGLNPLDPSDAQKDLDGDGINNLDEYNDGSNISADDVPPVLDTPEDIQINSTGPETPVDLGNARAVDAKDGEIEPVADFAGPFVPGLHIVTWSAKDHAGNEATGTQEVRVIPMATLTGPMDIEEGESSELSVILNGNAVTYPVTIPISYGGTAEKGTDYTVLLQEVSIQEGTKGTFSIVTKKDDEWEGLENIHITFGQMTNAVPGIPAVHTLNIKEENIAPSVTVSFFQNNKDVCIVSKDGGTFQVCANVTDPNPDDLHGYAWSEISSGLTSTLMCVEIDPLNLDPGLYSFNVIVTDDGEGMLSESCSGEIKIIEQLPSLSDENDTDGDGISDYQEGLSDFDHDRIPDYLDSDSTENHLFGDSNGSKLQTTAGQRLVLGTTAFSAGKNYASITVEDIKSHGGNLGAPGKFADDTGYGYSCGIFDFDLFGVPDGETALVVIPLLAALPDGASYRKYQAGSGWAFFNENQKNIVYSSPGVLGACPAPGDESYQVGLEEGCYCVQLLIEDGGPNDADGVANGVIKDPGGVSVKVMDPIQPTDPVSPTDSTPVTDPGKNQTGGGGGGCFINSTQW